MGWLRLVGSFNFYVFFAKEPYKRDDVLQKRPVILRSLLIIATPYQNGYCIMVKKIMIILVLTTTRRLTLELVKLYTIVEKNKDNSRRVLE